MSRFMTWDAFNKCDMPDTIARRSLVLCRVTISFKDDRMFLIREEFKRPEMGTRHCYEWGGHKKLRG